MKCPKCGSVNITGHDPAGVNWLWCHDCGYIWSIEQQSKIAELGQELEAVMLSVDKWLEVPSEDNPATRASDAREIALKVIDRLEQELAKEKSLVPVVLDQEQEISRLRLESATLTQTIEAQRGEIARLQSIVSSGTQSAIDNHNLNRDGVGTLRAELVLAKQDRDSANDEIYSLRAEVAKLREDLDYQRKCQEEKWEEIQSLKSQLQAANNSIRFIQGIRSDQDERIVTFALQLQAEKEENKRLRECLEGIRDRCTSTAFQRINLHLIADLARKGLEGKC
jgi:chromosome segregation ATPase